MKVKVFQVVMFKGTKVKVLGTGDGYHTLMVQDLQTLQIFQVLLNDVSEVK